IIISIIITEKGNAVIIAIFCNALNPLFPPEKSNTNAIKAWAKPQIIFIVTDGFNDPNVVCIPKTNVAESADVTKNVTININVIIDSTNPNGTASKTPNSAVSEGISNIFGLLLAVSIPSTPKAENQTILTNTGA